MTRLRLAVLLLLTALAALVATGCGSDSDGPAGGGDDVESLLRDTFSGTAEVSSGHVDVSLGIEGTGPAAEELQGPVTVRLSGPFAETEEGRLPRFSLEASVQGAGQDVSAGAVSTGDAGFVLFQGQAYELSAPVFRQLQAGYEESVKEGSGTGSAGQGSLGALGLHPLAWLSDPRNDGEADVGGTPTIKITSGVDVNALLDDVDAFLAKARTFPGTEDVPSEVPDKLTPAQRQQVQQAVKDARIEVYTGEEDHVLRRLHVILTIDPPDEEGTATVTFDVTMTRLGEDVEIAAPAGAKPFDELLGAFLGSASSGSGASATTAQDLEKYTDCIASAGSDEAEVRECADLLTP